MAFPSRRLSDSGIPYTQPTCKDLDSHSRMYTFGRWGPASTHTQTQSLLVDKLPAEIRTRIWTMLVGDRVLHPIEEKKHGWKFTACVNERTPQQLYDLSRTRDDALFSRDGCSPNTDRDSVWQRVPSEQQQKLVRIARSAQFGHHECPRSVEPYRIATGYVRRAEPDFLANLTVIRICKKFHNEIVHTFWATNTFSFFDIASWVEFSKAVGIAERDAIRSLDLSLQTCALSSDGPRCSHLILRGLKSLYLHICDSKHERLSQHNMVATSGYIRRLLGGATELQNTNINIIIDNAALDICWCCRALNAFYHDALVFTHKHYLDMADTMSQQIKSANIQAQIIPSTGMTHSPELVRLTTTSVHKAMYVCNVGSTLEECDRFHQKLLKERFGNRDLRIKLCGAEHRCIDCRRREGTSLLYGASYHCPRPGYCSDPARYNDVNPYVMPLEDIGTGYEAGEEDNNNV